MKKRANLQKKIQNQRENQKEINSEFSYDYNCNAPFFYYISIISYLFKNLPFEPKTVEYFAINNNKRKSKPGILKTKRNTV